MAILAECPICRNKQSVKKKICKCGEDLDKAKRGQRVRYWIQFRLPDGTQRKESVGFSIKEAQDADGKRKVQKRENRIFDMLPESKITFNELADWYKELDPVKKLTSYDRVILAITNFNKIFGDRQVNSVKLMDLESYQVKRQKDDGRAPATIDMEISITKTMVTKAFDNDMIDGTSLKSFRKVKRILKRGANARRRVLSFEEYLLLLDHASVHLKLFLIVAFNTGMRSGELRGLKWAHVDRKEGFLRVPANLTKEKKDKTIPINHNVSEVIDGIVRHINHDRVLTYSCASCG